MSTRPTGRPSTSPTPRRAGSSASRPSAAPPRRSRSRTATARPRRAGPDAPRGRPVAVAAGAGTDLFVAEARRGLVLVFDAARRVERSVGRAPFRALADWPRTPAAASSCSTAARSTRSTPSACLAPTSTRAPPAPPAASALQSASCSSPATRASPCSATARPPARPVALPLVDATVAGQTPVGARPVRPRRPRSAALTERGSGLDRARPPRHLARAHAVTVRTRSLRPSTAESVGRRPTCSSCSRPS